MDIQKQDFTEVLNLIRKSKQYAYKQINRTLIELYWDIGGYVSTKASKENWGRELLKN